MTAIPATLTERDIAKTIDHSLLRPELDDDFIEDGCRLAAEYDVASVCVRPADVPALQRRDACQSVRRTPRHYWCGYASSLCSPSSTPDRAGGIGSRL